MAHGFIALFHEIILFFEVLLQVELEFIIYCPLYFLSFLQSLS